MNRNTGILYIEKHICCALQDLSLNFHIIYLPSIIGIGLLHGVGENIMTEYNPE